jgi:hypothetical protein
MLFARKWRTNGDMTIIKFISVYKQHNLELALRYTISFPSLFEWVVNSELCTMLTDLSFVTEQFAAFSVWNPCPYIWHVLFMGRVCLQVLFHLTRINLIFYSNYTESCSLPLECAMVLLTYGICSPDKHWKGFHFMSTFSNAPFLLYSSSFSMVHMVPFQCVASDLTYATSPGIT